MAASEKKINQARELLRCRQELIHLSKGIGWIVSLNYLLCIHKHYVEKRERVRMKDIEKKERKK